jgi:AraC-like DNA-binding protein
MTNGALAERLERMLADAEAACACCITLHDRHGAFFDLLRPERFWHRHPFCAADRDAVEAYGARCYAHCLRDLRACCALPEQEPFLHHCWKGGTEACAAIHRDGRHLLTLFAGVWRSGDKAPRELSPSATQAWRNLVTGEEARLLAIAGLLQSLGSALLAALDAPRPVQTLTRRERIERLIDADLGRDLSPEQLGERLQLSASRCAHVVHELFGLSLGALQRSRRLARAKQLLLTSDEGVAEIAERCGFGSASWFNRLFVRDCGETPARWRRRQRQRA